MIQRFLQRVSRPAPPSGEEGAIVVVAAIGAATLLLFIVMVLEQGTVFAGRTQLQHAADAGARGALMRAAAMANDPKNPMRGDPLREEARAMAFAAIKGGTVIMTTPDRRDFSVELGSFEGGVFRPDGKLTTPPQAARVTASPKGGLGELFNSGRNLNASATAIAAYPCRNVALTTDSSASFVDNEDKVKNGLKTAISDIFANPVGSDGELVVIGFAGENLTRRVSAGGVSRQFRLNSAASDEPAARKFVDDLPFCDLADRTIFDFFTDPIPDCAGTHMQSALQVARQRLNAIDNQCINMIVLLSDGDPCVVAGRGSNKRDTFNEARAANADGISIAPIFLNDKNDRAVECPTQDRSFPATDEEFLRALRSGYGALLESEFDVAKIAENIRQALIRIPPVLVD